MIPSICSVIRDSILIALPTKHLVVGDVVVLKAGDCVPADIYLFHANDFKVDNSSLTGESEPQTRYPGPNTMPFLDATNLVFNGTTVVSGQAYGIVIRIGENTVIGQIMELTQCEESRKSPASEELEALINRIGLLASITAIFFFLFSIQRGEGIGYVLDLLHIFSLLTSSLESYAE